MTTPHPKEKLTFENGNQMTWLAYFTARCPKPYPPETSAPYRPEMIKADCENRIEWARAMLHALWPVEAQNSGAAK